MWHACERRESVQGLWWENPDETDHLELQGLDETMGSECIFGRLAWECGVDPVGAG
jgi:hypothetical protein